MTVCCQTCLAIYKDGLLGLNLGMVCPIHENAIKRGVVRADSHEERPGVTGDVPLSGGMREPVPVQRHQGHFYEQVASCPEDNPQPGTDQTVREESGQRPIPLEWLLEFGEACDTLCRRLRSLGGCYRTVGRGHIFNTLRGCGFGVDGAGDDVPVPRPTEEMGTTVFGCYPVNTPSSCVNWPYCERCGPPRL